MAQNTNPGINAETLSQQDTFKEDLSQATAETEEQLQKVIDLENNDKDLSLAHSVEEQSVHVQDKQQTKQRELLEEKVANVQPTTSGTVNLNLVQDDQLQYILPWVKEPPTPPPTPTKSGADVSDTEMVSETDVEFLEYTEEVTSLRKQHKSREVLVSFDDGETDKSTKDKKTKRTDFKITSVADTSSDYNRVEFQHSKVTTSLSRKDYELEKQNVECSRFAGVEKFASNFIEKIIDKSINNIITNQMAYLQSDLTTIDEEDESTIWSLRTYAEMFGTFTRWPRIQEFSRELGESTINDYMQTWDYDAEWLFCIDFLLEQSDDCSDYYLYEAKWSIPTRPYPIPQATASIYFTIEVCRIKPKYCPVDVTYVFEGSRLVHTPGKIQFQEHWLFSIIDSKLKLFKRITF